MKIPLSKGTYLIDHQRAINLYPVLNKAGKYYEFFGTEGLELFVTLSGSAIRGLYVATNDDTKLYVVAGNKVYKVLTNGDATENAVTLDTSQGMVEFSDNGTQIMITDGMYGYVYTIATDVLAKIADADFPGGASNTFLDGYTIVAKPGDDQINSSSAYDSTAWDALDFANAEGVPDNLQRVMEFGQKLFLFGIISTEVWFNDGGTGLPFTRLDGAVLNYGLSSKNSLAKNDQAMYFLARTRASEGERIVVEVRGYQAEMVSDEGVNRLLGTLSDTANAEGFAYMREGHSFYELTFPSDEVTLVYDAKERQWHERRSLTAAGGEIRHRARCYAYFNGWHMVGDFEMGKIYKLRPDVYTENGTAIIRKLVPPEISDNQNGQKFSINELIVPIKVGVGNAITDYRYEARLADGTYSAGGEIKAGGVEPSAGLGPILMFRYSKDGGNTWSNEKQASFGRQGEYSKRVKFRQLGQCRRFIPELSVSDPVEVRFTGPLMVPER